MRKASLSRAIPRLPPAPAPMERSYRAGTHFAERIGHRFQHDYAVEVSSGVYESLLDLARFTLEKIRPFGARDFIGVHSFIWVVGAYADEHKLDHGKHSPA